MSISIATILFMIFSFFLWKISQTPKPYSFDWSVKDDESKNDYGHKETSDGKVVTGSYRVVLPDGRTQIVTYKADENGYVADIKYEGEAKYPEPEYKPTPSKYWEPCTKAGSGNFSCAQCIYVFIKERNNKNL